ALAVCRVRLAAQDTALSRRRPRVRIPYAVPMGSSICSILFVFPASGAILSVVAGGYDADVRYLGMDHHSGDLRDLLRRRQAREPRRRPPTQHRQLQAERRHRRRQERPEEATERLRPCQLSRFPSRSWWAGTAPAWAALTRPRSNWTGRSCSIASS